MSKNQRFAVLVLLAAVLAALFLFPPTGPGVPPQVSALLFASLFLLSFSSLLLEHFFSRPTDVLAAAVSILLLLVPSRPLLASWGPWYWVFLGYELLLVLLATIALLLLTEGQGPGSLRNRSSQILKTVSVSIGSGRIQYFWLFLLSLVFFVEPRSIPFVSFLLYGTLVFFLQPQKLATKLPALVKHQAEEIGDIFGVQGKNTFLVRLHSGDSRPPLRVADLLEFSYSMDEPRRVRRGVILERFFLDQAQWIRVLSHEEIDRHSADLQPLEKHRKDAVYKRADRDAGEFLGSLIGVVQDGTDIGTLRFLQAGRSPVEEGDLVQVQMPAGPVLYQVVNARVDTESLESKNEADFVVGEAFQLGRWDETRRTFDRFGWVPSARTPVTKAREIRPPERKAGEIELGKVPGTNFPVLLSAEEAISHHTAILGVTGVGKSVFARNLVRQILSEDLRVIVVDFTREWKGHFGKPEESMMIGEEDAKPLHKAISEIAVETAKFKNQQCQEYIYERKKLVFEGFRSAIDGFLTGQDRIRVFELPDLSNTEGVLEYTQWFFRTLFTIARDSGNHGKRVCIVLEEAHTVVPEWNFIGLADKSSQSLVNNISQIALQGRKYGVGFFVIAQRTASVSKTVLTQCNTVISFQCFDGTSIEFLSHYLPKSVADALPNLRFRRAVAVGKAIRGTVPLMFEVPEIREEEPF